MTGDRRQATGDRRPGAARRAARGARDTDRTPHATRHTPQDGRRGGLGEAIGRLVQERGRPLRALAREARLAQPNKLYRVAAGDSRDVRLPMLLDLCRALDCDPDLLLELAGLWPLQGAGGRGQATGTCPLQTEDVRLRLCEQQIARWPCALRARALRVLQALGPDP